MTHELDLEQEDSDKLDKAGQKAKGKKLVNADAHGAFEERGAHLGATGARLDISAPVKTWWGSSLVQHEASYNMYTAPLAATLRAMGRLKDLQAAGAPLEPAMLDKDKATAAHFHKPVPHDGRKRHGTQDTGDALNAMGDWSSAQTELQVATLDYYAGQQQLRAAIQHFEKARMMLERRKTGAELEGTKAKKADIDRHASTLANIIRVSSCALTAVSTLDGIINQTLEPIDTSDADIVTDPLTGADRANAASTKTKAQSLGDMAQKSADLMKMVSKDKVAGWLEKGGVSLEDIMIVAMGEAGAYQDLQKQIADLQQELAKLDLDIENKEIQQAETALGACKLDLNARKKMVDAKRVAARRGAETFGTSVDGGQQGVLAMMAAEAYHEVALFGRQADAQRQPLDRNVGRFSGILVDNQKRFEAMYWEDDWNALRQNMVDLKAQKDYFGMHLWEWEQRSAAWDQMLKEQTGWDLVGTK